MMNLNIKRGEIYLANLSPNNGDKSSIQTGVRPVIIISNEKANQFSPVITVIPLSSKMTKAKLPTHVMMSSECGLTLTSVALCEQILTLDKKSLQYKLGECTEEKMKQVERAIKIQTQMVEPFSMTYIENKVFSINKLKELFSMTGHKDILKMFNFDLSELKLYCGDYNKNYKVYFDDTIENNTNNLQVG